MRRFDLKMNTYHYVNTSFPSSNRSLFQSESRCELFFLWLLVPISIWMKTDIHNNDFAPRLTLKLRLKWPWKWPIKDNITKNPPETPTHLVLCYMTSTHVQLRNANSHERQKLFYTSERFDSLPIASLVPPISAALARQDARNPQVVKEAMSSC